MPYPMHPWTLRSLPDQDFAAFRCRPRPWGVFFAGNQKPKYGNDKMLRDFALMSRLEVLETVNDHFSDSVRTELPGSSESASFVLVDSRSTMIDASQWLNTLAGASFFLCCPGAAQPTCHNLIEAMSVGTIPIIEYGDRLSPPLRHMENAICFSGKQDLIKACELALSLPDSERRQLSQRVHKHYDRHLCGPTYLKSIRDETIPIPNQQICVPFHDHDRPPIRPRRGAATRDPQTNDLQTTETRNIA